MKIIKIIGRLIEYVKSFFKKEAFLRDDDFLEIFRKANELIHASYGSGGENIERISCIKECVREMLLTEEPEIFAANYQNAADLAEEAVQSSSGRAAGCARELASMLKALPRGCESTDGERCYRVTFRSKRKTYCYLSVGKKFAIGQHVLAPAGDDMKICVVRIVGEEKFESNGFTAVKAELKEILGSALY